MDLILWQREPNCLLPRQFYLLMILGRKYRSFPSVQWYLILRRQIRLYPYLLIQLLWSNILVPCISNSHSLVPLFATGYCRLHRTYTRLRVVSYPQGNISLSLLVGARSISNPFPSTPIYMDCFLTRDLIPRCLECAH